MVDSLSIWIWGIVALDLAVAVAAICALRYGSGVLFGVDSGDELAERDNLAFGVALAGGALAVALILAAAAAGDPAITLGEELGVVVAYAVVGLVLLKLGVLVNDWIVFHHFSIREAIGGQNAAAGTAQAANLIAIGVLINGAIGWADGGLVQGLAAVVVVFLLSQLVVLAVTRMRAAIYARRHDGQRWQDAIAGGNTALGVRYAGHLVGASLAASSAGGMVSFVPGWDVVALGRLRLVAGVGDRPRGGAPAALHARATRGAARHRRGRGGGQPAQRRCRGHRGGDLPGHRPGDTRRRRLNGTRKAPLEGDAAAPPLPHERRDVRFVPVSTEAARLRLHDAALIGAMGLVAACGLVYEYLLAHYAGRILGAVEPTIYTMIGLMIVAMGLGAFAAKWISAIYRGFAWLELGIALLGGASVLALSAAVAVAYSLPEWLRAVYNVGTCSCPWTGRRRTRWSRSRACCRSPWARSSAS